uniref:SAM domain-containing protein n=1 Tax=Labrus bergylta TaxID=56723 RepID=A0A3Q3EN44_9LABR
MTEVKVHKTCADRFVEEEVSGDSLVAFKKTDILDLGIKHGPAVKIISYLESLRDGLQRDQFPAYVENWTKEQVHQWLLQHVNAYSKYAIRLQEEDVSGDCLVCFKKQDLLDLEVKSGPAVKILSNLRQLSKDQEPTLQPIPHNEQKEAPNPIQPEVSVAQTVASDPAEPFNTTEVQADKMLGKKSGKAQQQFKKASEEKKSDEPKPQNFKARRKETMVVNCLHCFTHSYTLQGLTLKPFSHMHSYKYLDNFNVYFISCTLLLISSVLLVLPKALTLSVLFSHITFIFVILRFSQHLLSRDKKKEANQGDKLKNLLTCGGNSLDNYDNMIIVVNKSSPEQVQYLKFLNKLKLFCVLDFDPDSNTQVGLCHSYRESRWANLHTPSQYQGQIDSVIKNLNLYKQTSWVFCNGRHDLEGDSNKELNYWNWVRKSCSDVEQLVSFICNPEVLLHGRSLIMFLLLSPVDSEKDPIFETYRAFMKKTEEEMIIHICESQIYELSLSEVNGTVLALRPFSESSERLLPSSDSSFVVLKNKDEDLLTALDILCLNQCENIYEDNSPEFNDKRTKVEEEFYRGGKVKWWNFFFCDKDKQRPFIKRDKYENLKRMIRSELRESKEMCVLLNLFHNPGCGGTTLAMHVMWDLRKEIRCAVLKDNSLPMTEVAVQVVKLMKLENEKPCQVLLLIDDSKETENPYEICNCIPQTVESYSNINVDKAQSCKVIILNCVRSQNPKDSYRRHNPSQYITASLSPEEQNEFEKKLNELRETHDTPENFYSFMIMKSNFDKKYIDDLVHNTLENFDFSSKNAKLFSFLALLNTYVTESEISRSLCEDFLGMKRIRWQEESALDRMEPFSNLLIIDRVEEWGVYEGIRILHSSIASACLEEFERSHSLKVSDITIEVLHCDLFFSIAVVKKRFMDSIQQMLIARQQKKDGVVREPFSPLIDKIHSEQGRQTVQQIFVKASSRFEKSASIPQALARYLYIKEHDFPEALKWAEKAKNIKANPYTFDTIGQIHKSNLRSNNDRGKQETSCNPEDLNTNIKIASNAITAFKKAQELANSEEEPEEEAVDESDDYPRKSYNVKGYVGVLEIAFLVFEILSRLPFFDQRDPMKKTYFQSFLKKAIPITSVYKEDNERNNIYEEIIKEHERFLQNLKTEVKETFELLDCFFTYIKGRNSEFQTKNHSIACDLFKRYERRLFLEKNQADTFAGILQHLDKPAEEIERITECYAYLQKQHHQLNDKKQKTKETINCILSNIVLYLLKPNSKHVKSIDSLSDLLSTTLQDVGLRYPFPDPYYLALLLFWPRTTEEDTEIATYVTAIRNSTRKYLTPLFQKRSTVAHLYLGKEKGLKRLVSKPQLDENFKKMRRETLAQLWRNGDIFKDKTIINRLQRVRGSIEQGRCLPIMEN